MKRLIVCCDGTGMNGTVMQDISQYTNVLRLARSINRSDANRTIPQIVFYQSGIGSENDFFTQYMQKNKPQNLFEKGQAFYAKTAGTLEGATGGPLAEKVQEAYTFIATNYEQDDEIFLFGFSRGAYTARMVAAFIGKIGILDTEDMDHFGSIFIAFQMLGKLDKADPARVQSKAIIHRYRRLKADKDSFSIKCVGVFDTVGSVGLPGEITGSKTVEKIFGFSDNKLGRHIERAYHAVAINERRADFQPTMFEQQTEKDGQYKGQYKKGQILEQCWFTGVHSDIGGGYHDHDLSDLSLMWMAANISDMLSLNINYLEGIPHLVKPWGELPPHNSLVGVYTHADRIPSRVLPTSTNDETHETIHSSVLKQPLPDALKGMNPDLVCKLLPLEEQIWSQVKYVPGQYPSIAEPEESEGVLQWGAEESAKKVVEVLYSHLV
jgi:uncharacterized protein (DUF2235 family)